MNDKISNKDKIDWENFLRSKERLVDKDYREKNNKVFSTKSIDLHANRTIEKFVSKCYAEQVNKLIVVTGKGIHSNNEKNPYVSKDLSILKYSVPEFISNNKKLNDMIYDIQEAKLEDGGSGAFYIYLKKNKKK